MKLRRAFLVACSLALPLGLAHAQSEWPARPVILVVPSADAYGRLLAQALGEHFRQSFVVEYKYGATAVAQAAADGHTFSCRVQIVAGNQPEPVQELRL